MARKKHQQMTTVPLRVGRRLNQQIARLDRLERELSVLVKIYRRDTRRLDRLINGFLKLK